MAVLQGVLLTGAAATGVVVAERVRHRGTGEDVREDVTEFGEAIADQVGKAIGFAGHVSGTVLGKGSEFANDLGDRTTQAVTGAGRTLARGAGAAMGAYAGAIDRLLPTFGRAQSVAPSPTHKQSAPKKSAPAKRAAARRKAG